MPNRLNKSIDVACAGILCADVMAKTVDRLPEKGKLLLVEQLQLHIGGCAANTAIDLSRLGARAAILGKTGNDGFGRFLAEKLASEGVDIRGLKTGEAPTSASVVAIGSDSERSILHCLGANGLFCYEDINRELVDAASILFIAGTFLMPSFDGEGTVSLLRDGKATGALCCMDTAWDSSGKWMELIGDSLQYLDWFMPSYEEARELSGETDPSRIAQVFAAKGAANIVVKLGAGGCYVKPAGEGGFTVPAYTNITVADTSGAGDAFCAGFLAGLSHGWEPYRCARFANAVGAHCVMAIGTTTGVKPMAEIDVFMQMHDSSL